MYILLSVFRIILDSPSPDHLAPPHFSPFPRPQLHILRPRRRQISPLVRNQHARYPSAGERRQRPAYECRDGESGHVPAPAGRDLGQHADLRAERADVREAAQAVSGDQARARREGRVDGFFLEGGVGYEFVLCAQAVLVDGK